MSIGEAYHRVRLRLENWRPPAGVCLSLWETDDILADVVAFGHTVLEEAHAVVCHPDAMAIAHGTQDIAHTLEDHVQAAKANCWEDPWLEVATRLDALLAPAEGGQKESTE